MSRELTDDCLQKLLTPPDSSEIYSFVKKTARKYLQPFSSNGLLCIEGGYEKSQLLTNISLYPGNGTRYGRSYNGRRIGTRMQSIEWRFFQ